MFYNKIIPFSVYLKAKNNVDRKNIDSSILVPNTFNYATKYQLIKPLHNKAKKLVINNLEK